MRANTTMGAVSTNYYSSEKAHIQQSLYSSQNHLTPIKYSAKSKLPTLNNTSSNDERPLNDCRHQATSNTKCQGGVTEIVFPPNTFSQSLLLPSLASLSQTSENRWLTWINPPASISKELLYAHGFDLSKIRFVYNKHTNDTMQLLKAALNIGNSHTVVCNTSDSDKIGHSQLEHSAINGKCQGILLRTR